MENDTFYFVFRFVFAWKRQSTWRKELCENGVTKGHEFEFSWRCKRSGIKEKDEQFPLTVEEANKKNIKKENG